MHLSRHANAPDSPELLPGKGCQALIQGVDNSTHILLPPLETEQDILGMDR